MCTKYFQSQVEINTDPNYVQFEIRSGKLFNLAKHISNIVGLLDDPIIHPSANIIETRLRSWTMRMFNANQYEFIDKNGEKNLYNIQIRNNNAKEQEQKQDKDKDTERSVVAEFNNEQNFFYIHWDFLANSNECSNNSIID